MGTAPGYQTAIPQFSQRNPISSSPHPLTRRRFANSPVCAFLSAMKMQFCLGPPGVGKTHLAVSLGMEAIRQGFGVYFVSLPDLLERLVQGQAENRMRR